MCLPTYTYTHKYIHTHIYTHTHTFTLIYTYKCTRFARTLAHSHMLSQIALQKQHQLLNSARNKLMGCVNMEQQSKQYDLRKLVAHANLYDKLSSSIVLNNNMVREQYLQSQQQQQLQAPILHEEADSDSDSDWDSLSDSDSDAETDTDSEYEYEYDCVFNDAASIPRSYSKLEHEHSHVPMDMEMQLSPSVSHREYTSLHIDSPERM